MVEERVKNVIGQVFNLNPGQIDQDFSKDTSETWDSLNQITLVSALEEEFGIRFSDEDVLQMMSYKLILAILKEHNIK